MMSGGQGIFNLLLLFEKEFLSFEKRMKPKRNTPEVIGNWFGQLGCLALFIIVFLILIWVAYSILSTPKYF